MCFFDLFLGLIRGLMGVNKLVHDELFNLLTPTEKMIYEAFLSIRDDVLNSIKKRDVVGFNVFGETSREFDERISDLIIGSLRKEGFTGHVVTEEKIDKGNGNEIIYVDPVDGSLNAARGIPLYCFEMGYNAYKDFKNMQFGLIWIIPSNQVYIGLKDRGNYLISGDKFEKIETKRWDLEDTVIEISNTSGEILNELKKLGTTRSLGSIAYSITKLIEGNIEAIFDLTGKLKLTDIAGGITLINEAKIDYMVEIFEEKMNPRIGIIASVDKKLYKSLIQLKDSEKEV
mgnify:CR=1 FL=1